MHTWEQASIELSAVCRGSYSGFNPITGVELAGSHAHAGSTRPANAPPIRGKAEIRPPGGKVRPCCASYTCSYITLQDIRQVACSLSQCWLTSSWTLCPPHAACVQVVHELMHTASGNKEFMQALAAKAPKP